MRHKRKVTQRMGDTVLVKFNLSGLTPGMKHLVLSPYRIERAVVQALKDLTLKR